MSLIRELYMRKPLLVEMKIRQWLSIGDSKELKLVEIDEDGLEFQIQNLLDNFGDIDRTLYVTDTSLSDYTDEAEANLEYQKFMTRIFGKKYINKLVQTRNATRNEWVKDFDEETRKLEYKLSLTLNLHETLGPKVKPVEEINDSDLGFY